MSVSAPRRQKQGGDRGIVEWEQEAAATRWNNTGRNGPSKWPDWETIGILSPPNQVREPAVTQDVMERRAIQDIVRR